MYHAYEIKCTSCGHRFSWLKGSYEGSSSILYKRKDICENLMGAVCPKCGDKLAIIEDKQIGVSVYDEAIEVADTIRGI